MVFLKMLDRAFISHSINKDYLVKWKVFYFKMNISDRLKKDYKAYNLTKNLQNKGDPEFYTGFFVYHHTKMKFSAKIFFIAYK